MPTALIAEDEPLLASELRDGLTRLWPELSICAMASDGHAALNEIQARRPDILFLDVQMPGLTGIEVARIAGARAHVVFITAFDQYAIEAFEQGAVDYLLKPLDAGRLARAVHRLRDRISQVPADLTHLLSRLQREPTAEPLRWITVLSGREVRLITVDEICYFRAENKYVSVVTADNESLITTSMSELLPRLDRQLFWQIHRNAVVNINAVHSVRRSVSGHLELRLKKRSELLRVSSANAHLFKHM